MGILGGKKKPKPEEVYAAVKVNNMETLADLLSKGCDPNGHLDAMTGDTSLHLATNKNRAKAVELLIAYKANVNIQNKIGSAALHCAAGYGMTALVRKLLEAGADVGLVDAEGKTAVELAQAYGQADTAELLKSR